MNHHQNKETVISSDFQTSVGVLTSFDIIRPSPDYGSLEHYNDFLLHLILLGLLCLSISLSFSLSLSLSISLSLSLSLSLYIYIYIPCVCVCVCVCAEDIAL